MLKYVRELATYIANNAPYIVNYGERYRNGERISTSFTESAINQVVSKRMVKKQQMQWTPEGAHLLLHVRTQVLNEDWADTFRTWYPDFRPANIEHGGSVSGLIPPAFSALPIPIRSLIGSHVTWHGPLSQHTASIKARMVEQGSDPADMSVPTDVSLQQTLGRPSRVTQMRQGCSNYF